MLNEQEQEDFLGMCKELFRDIEGILKKPDPPQLVTPPGIKFWATDTGIPLGLLFNEDKQYLKYHQFDNVFEVQSAKGLTASQIQEALPMTACAYEDVKPGEFFSENEKLKLQSSVGLKLLGNYGHVKTCGMDITRYILGDDNTVWKIGKC